MFGVEVTPRDIEEDEFAIRQLPHERRGQRRRIAEDDHEIGIIKCGSEYREFQRLLVHVDAFGNRRNRMCETFPAIGTRIDDDDDPASAHMPHAITSPGPKQAVDESSNQSLSAIARDVSAIWTHRYPTGSHRCDAVDDGVDSFRPAHCVGLTPFIQRSATHDDV